MGLADLAAGMAMRDVIETIVASAIERLRPKYRYAVVNSIDHANRKCTITFNGESNPVIVNIGSIFPSSAGQVVRIEGIGTDKYVSDVVGDPGAIAIYSAANVAEQSALVAAHSPTATSPLFVFRADRPLAPIQYAIDSQVWYSVTTTLAAFDWSVPAFENGWVNYTASLTSFGPMGYWRTASGVVTMRGLIKDGSAGGVTTLDAADAPSSKRMFPYWSSASTIKRVDANNTGAIILAAGYTTAYNSLHNIIYNDDPSLTWTAVTFQNGFSNYAGYQAAEYAKDTYGRVWLRGVIKAGTTVDATVMFNLPAGFRPSLASHLVSTQNEGVAILQVTAAGDALYSTGNAGAGTYLSIEASFTASSGGSAFSPTWADITLLNSWVNYGAGFPTAQYAKYPDGMVRVRGLIKSGTSVSIAATLPVGFRPRTRVLTAAVSYNLPARVDVYANGDIEMNNTSGTWASLSSLVFFAES